MLVLRQMELLLVAEKVLAAEEAHRVLETVIAAPGVVIPVGDLEVGIVVLMVPVAAAAVIIVANVTTSIESATFLLLFAAWLPLSF